MQWHLGLVLLMDAIGAYEITIVDCILGKFVGTARSHSTVLMKIWLFGLGPGDDQMDDRPSVGFADCRMSARSCVGVSA